MTKEELYKYVETEISALIYYGYSEGKKNNDICRMLDLKPSMVSQTIKKLKLINNEN